MGLSSSYSLTLAQSGCMFTTRSVLFMPFFPFISPRNVSQKATREHKDRRRSRVFSRRNHPKELRLLRYIYITCIYYSKSPYLFLVANVNVVIIFIVIIIECTEKRYKYQENESTETFRRVDRLAADFNRLGDFYDRDNAHSGCFFSDRDTREHGRYVFVCIFIREERLFLLVLPYFYLC